MAANGDHGKLDRKKMNEVKRFFVGLKAEDKLVVKEKKNKFCRIISSTPSLENEIRFNNIPDLKEQLLTALRKAKESMVDGDTCSVSTRILGEPSWKLKAGSYKCSDIAERKIDWQCNKDVVEKMKRKYQPTLEKKNQLTVVIKIGAEDTLFYRKFTDDDKDYAFIDVGHGYFLYPDKQYTSLYIVDPRKNILIMVLLRIHSGANPKYKSLVKKHDDKLKECLQKYSFSHPGKILLPEGYSPQKQHTYNNLISKLSDETELLIQEFKTIGYPNHAKLHFVNKKLVSKMNEKEWKEEDVTTMIEESLVQIDSLLTLLEVE